jgi:dodecin
VITNITKRVIIMSAHHSYKKIEMVGSSKNSIEEAIQNALGECSKTIKNMDWFEVVETRGHIVDGKVGHFQVTIKIGFKIENS